MGMRCRGISKAAYPSRATIPNTAGGRSILGLQPMRSLSGVLRATDPNQSPICGRPALAPSPTSYQPMSLIDCIKTAWLPALSIIGAWGVVRFFTPYQNRRNVRLAKAQEDYAYWKGKREAMEKSMKISHGYATTPFNLDRYNHISGKEAKYLERVERLIREQQEYNGQTKSPKA